VRAVKPKKMIRVEGKTIVTSACNCGSSVLVSRDGEVFVFGKDTFHADNTTGIVLVLLVVAVVVVADNTIGIVLVVVVAVALVVVHCVPKNAYFLFQCTFYKHYPIFMHTVY